MIPTIPWSSVCKRCLKRAKPITAGLCEPCHAEVVAEINARWSLPALQIGPPMYADCASWIVISGKPSGRLRVRLLSGVDFTGLVTLTRTI
jgi:hypothetical protein